MSVEQFDAIIIGAGQSGGPLSTALGAEGWKTAIIEKDNVGGTCVNTGCTPTKTMIASARAAYMARRAGDYGVQAGDVAVDLTAVRERKRSMVEAFRGGSQRSIEGGKNVELVFGEATFTASHQIEIRLFDGRVREMHAGTVVINTGTRPRTLDVPGLAAAHPLDSTSIMELEEVPERLLVVGGGAVGLEFSQMFRRFGSEVTILQRSERLLAQEDQDVAAGVTEILAEDGIEVVCDASLEGVRPDGSSFVAKVVAGDCSREISFDRVLVSAGRVSNGDLLNLEATGVKTDDRGYIQVDERLRTNVSGIYALGDANGGPAFTHISFDDYRIMRDNLIHDAGRTTAGRMLPYVIFIDPQLGRIGLSEREARETGRQIAVFKLPMSSVARALEVDETRGLMKAVVDRQTSRILGAAILGIEGGEIAGAIQIAMMGNLPYTALKEGIFAHPTLMEALNNLFSSPADS